MATTDTTPIPPSQNEGWGFYGTISRHIEPSKAWDAALPAIAAATGCSYDETRAFLDSRHGRHFADEVEMNLPQDGRGIDGAIAVAIAKWMDWTIGPKLSRATGIPVGLPYLTGFVVQAGLEAEAEAE